MKTWSLGGGPGHSTYRAYDWLRRRLNRRLCGWLLLALRRHCPGARPRVLEAGAGPATASSFLREEGARAAALDLDAEACLLGRRRDPALNRMVLSKIAGTRIPMLLNPRGYTGTAPG